MKPNEPAGRRRFAGFAVWQLYVLSAGAYAIGIVGVLCLCDPHFLNRMGALVVAVGAIMIVVQFRYDLEVERTKAAMLASSDREADRIGSDTSSSPVIKSIASRLLRDENEATLGGAEKLRSRAVLHVAIFTAAGVLVDGFGDYLAKALLSASGLQCH
jgi:hypothetical protein